MLKKERCNFVEQIEDISLNLLIVEKFAFVCTTETGKPDEAVMIVKEVLSEKYCCGISIDAVLKHLEFFKNGNGIAGVGAVFQPS